MKYLSVLTILATILGANTALAQSSSLEADKEAVDTIVGASMEAIIDGISASILEGTISMSDGIAAAQSLSGTSDEPSLDGWRDRLDKVKNGCRTVQKVAKRIKPGDQSPAPGDSTGVAGADSTHCDVSAGDDSTSAGADSTGGNRPPQPAPTPGN